MEVALVITSLCVILSLLVSQCSCSSDQTPLVPSHELGHDAKLAQNKPPRKLRPFEEPIVNTNKSKNLIPGANENVALQGKQYHHQSMLDGRKGTRQNWLEKNSWQYFTMDYARVRRRRPIHNKSITLGH
ncbi:hypothetical protein GIB67_001785 [Kingdonia uniflora]|uniref:Uncharacterized protein n=1 Tax=Kingdonia uniflora TaxID=39325 RepID=A0A7J7LBZ3_9MAGN|nr:hypothetical protein GIB67_001785 [Kingdonia uniflora]